MNTDVLNVLVAAAALFVAIRSVQFTSKANKRQIRHNVISVRPLPFIALADYENRIRVKVRNDGIGPMLVRKIVVNRRGQLPEFDELVSYMPELPGGMAWINFSSGYIRSIPANAELLLLEIAFDDRDPVHRTVRDDIRRSLSAIEVRVKYTDMYGSVFDDEVRYLNFFSRRLAHSKVD